MLHQLQSENEVHIWQFSLDTVVNTAILSSDERARAVRLKIPAAQAQFMHGRATLRQILSQYTGIDPQALQLTYNLDGKPSLTDADIHFNLTHCDNLALLAVAAVPVGVDLERIRAVDAMDAITMTTFTEDERQYLSTISQDRKIYTFFKLWTAKESVMKALGGGFKLAQTISLSLDEEQIIIDRIDGNQPQEWGIAPVNVPQGFIAAVAVQHPDVKLRYLNQA